MSTVTLADAQSRIGASVNQDQIDEAEAWLAARIGPLVGMRSETFYLSQRRRRWMTVDGLWLKRPTDSVLITSDDDDLVDGTDYRLLDNLLVERVPLSTVWGETMVATYDPNDEDIVRSVIFDRIVYAQTPEGLQSIRIGQYSETYATGSATPAEGAMLRRVLPAASMGAFGEPYRYHVHRRDRTLVEAVGS